MIVIIKFYVLEMGKMTKNILSISLMKCGGKSDEKLNHLCKEKRNHIFSILKVLFHLILVREYDSAFLCNSKVL